MNLNLERMKTMAGEDEWKAAEALMERGGVRLCEQTGKMLRYTVLGNARADVILSAGEMPRCRCDAFMEHGACRHILAAMLCAKQSGTLEELLRRKAVEAAPLLMNAMESALPRDGSITMEITLQVDREEGRELPEIRIGLRLGEDRLYVVRSIPQLMEAMEQGNPLEFGKGFTFHPEWMNFAPGEQRVLEILRALCLAQQERNAALHGADVRMMLLPEPFAEAVLQELTALPFRLAVQGKVIAVNRVLPAKLPLLYRVSSTMHGIMATGQFPRDFQPLTASCTYAYVAGRVIQLDEKQRSVMRVLWQEQVEGKSSFEYSLREASRLFGELIPFLKLTGMVEIAPELEKQLLRLPLQAQLYLDREGREVVARTVFRYGEKEIDPFAETPAPEALSRNEKLLLRDAAAERQMLDALGGAGFHISRGRVYLIGQDAIYDFVSGGIQKLQAIGEVYCSREFQKMAPRKPRLKGRMQLRGGRLELEFTENGEPAQEILGLMDALSKHKRYFRLKDGSFLDLSGMEEWQPLADHLTDAADAEGLHSLSGDTLTLQAYRACYLNSLLEECQLPVEVDDSIRQTVEDIAAPEKQPVKLPQGLTLRPYQQRGFQWLSTLDRLHMGGILADDMGLGKTVQVISLLKAHHRPEEVSLVVAPTSLTYNWLSELNRFAPELSVMVLSGSGPQRASQIRHVKEVRDVDVLITSYPLIRRDIDQMKDISFHFAILDEAQFIKNAGSVGAVAVKQLQAQTRFALTGTPMENSTGELWSIFDFVLPGYLNTYASFLRRYQDGDHAQELRQKIRPFLMRRLKKDVLTELPDKIEEIITAQMSPEQDKVYRAAMARLRTRVDQVMNTTGLGRGRTEVLAAITELRQICCHPLLVLPEYSGTAGKMELLLELLPGAMAAGRRILIFSQFTSMLKILRKQLENEGYTTMYLDGETPPAKRLEMTEQFNAGQGQVFLISLKAGGTGLNLTGADMVIHYDPWWNPAAEDQATDRAHRIGQTRKVEVIRLVTHDSIEEKVVELGQRKKALFDQLITPGEELVTALTEQDIRSLFA